MPGSGQGGWFGPDDEWPDHPKPWFREALEKARRRGWWLKEHSGHSFGTVYCQDPRGKPDTSDQDRFSGIHRYPVFSSGRAGETAARELRRLVDQCGHVPAGQKSFLERAENLLLKAERLLTGAVSLVDQLDHEYRATSAWARATELLDLIDESSDEVDQLIVQAMEAEEEARIAGDEAGDALAATGERVTSPSDLVDAAGRAATDAEDALREVPRAKTSELRRRLRLLRGRLEELRRRLSET